MPVEFLTHLGGELGSTGRVRAKDKRAEVPPARKNGGTKINADNNTALPAAA